MQNRGRCSAVILRATCGAATFAIAFVIGVIGVRPTQAQTYNVLYYFTGQADGEYPGGLVLGKNGTLYGNAGGGNANCAYLVTCGEIFELDKAGNESVLYAFAGGNDGAGPSGSLIVDHLGNLYGTTFYGGDGPCMVETTVVGCGTIFRLTPPATKGGGWAEAILYSFQGPDGATPYAGLAMDDAGTLYGTTYFGGTGSCVHEGGQMGCGTVFRLDGAGQETVLYSFTAGADGGFPMGGLVLDAAGNLYGTTNEGGDLPDCGNVGCGTVFKVSGAAQENVLYSFTGLNGDGEQPESVTLVRDPAGNLYGTTSAGGINNGGDGYGTVFKVNPEGKETILYSFEGFLDGGYPYAGLARDPEGNLYGTTSDFGEYKYYGTLFKITTKGNFDLLYSFDQISGSGGAQPLMDQTAANRESIYGAAASGGNYEYCGGAGCGTIFKFTP